jgi:hypothetical protein
MEATWRRRWVGGSALFAAALLWTSLHAYTTMRTLAVAAERLSVWRDQVLTTRHFVILYPAGLKPVARLVAELAERDYRIETVNLAVAPTARLTIVIYPTQATLDTSAGLPANADDIGLYDAGTIRIADPRSWIVGADWQRVFSAEGPVAHELGHALLDWIADGNYPSWFNEGVAQEEDYRATGYVWLTPENRLTGALYSMAQLDGNFYALPNQSLAYREGLSLVQFLIARRGQTAFDAFLRRLGQGGTFGGDLHAAYGFSPTSLFQAWHAWIDHHPGEEA